MLAYQALDSRVHPYALTLEVTAEDDGHDAGADDLVYNYTIPAFTVRNQSQGRALRNEETKGSYCSAPPARPPPLPP